MVFGIYDIVAETNVKFDYATKTTYKIINFNNCQTIQQALKKECSVLFQETAAFA